jgi:hypothetical protein
MHSGFPGFRSVLIPKVCGRSTLAFSALRFVFTITQSGKYGYCFNPHSHSSAYSLRLLPTGSSSLEVPCAHPSYHQDTSLLSVAKTGTMVALHPSPISTSKLSGQGLIFRTALLLLGLIRHGTQEMAPQPFIYDH